MPRLSEHEQSGAIGILKAGVCVSEVARYYICHLSAIQHLRYCYQATGTVKGWCRPGQPRMATNFKTATYINFNNDIYIDNVRSGWLPSVLDE